MGCLLMGRPNAATESAASHGGSKPGEGGDLASGVLRNTS